MLVTREVGADIAEGLPGVRGIATILRTFQQLNLAAKPAT